MRILIANYEFPPIGGGASKASFELARALVRRGEQVSVLTSRQAGAPATEVLDGVTVHRVWSWRKGVHECGLIGAVTFLIAALPKLRWLLRTGDFDVVHYFFGLPTGLLSVYSRLAARVPYIVSLRGSDVPLYDRDSRTLRFLHALTKSVSRRIWAGASDVFAVSRALRQLAEESFPRIDVGVIHNGVDCIGHERRTYGADAREAPVRVICVSRLIPRKGVHELVEAVASLRDLRIELVIVGTGPCELALRELAVRCGAADRVTFLGYRSPADVERENMRSDIFVLPTHSEAFANVILEAMSAGLPVAATRVGGVAEALIDGETGILVEPRQPAHLAAAIRRLAENPALREQLGRAGRERVARLFTWERTAAGYAAAYRQAIAAPFMPAHLEPLQPRSRPVGAASAAILNRETRG